MRYGYWLPVFGGWLRNVEDEGMEASWDYVRRLTIRSEETGWDLTLIAGDFPIQSTPPRSQTGRQGPAWPRFWPTAPQCRWTQ